MGKKLEEADKHAAELKRRLEETQSQLVHAYHFADVGLGTLSTKHLMASGVVLKMTVLGGKQPFSPVCIRDGLSDETIAALRKDIRRSYSTAIAYRPAGDKSPQVLVNEFYKLVDQIGHDRMVEALDNLRKTHNQETK